MSDVCQFLVGGFVWGVGSFLTVGVTAFLITENTAAKYNVLNNCLCV